MALIETIIHTAIPMSQKNHFFLPPSNAIPVHPISTLHLLKRKRKLRKRIPFIPLLLSPLEEDNLPEHSISLSSSIGNNVKKPVGFDSSNFYTNGCNHHQWNINSISGGIIEISGEAGSGKTQICK